MHVVLFLITNTFKAYKYFDSPNPILTRLLGHRDCNNPRKPRHPPERSIPRMPCTVEINRSEPNCELSKKSLTLPPRLLRTPLRSAAEERKRRRTDCLHARRIASDTIKKLDHRVEFQPLGLFPTSPDSACTL